MNLPDQFRALTFLHRHEDPMLQLHHGKWFAQTFFFHSDWSAPQVKELGVQIARWYMLMSKEHPDAIEAFETGSPAVYSTILK